MTLHFKKCTLKIFGPVEHIMSDEENAPPGGENQIMLTSSSLGGLLLPGNKRASHSVKLIFVNVLVI